MRRALVVVDVQNDFCECGSLAVRGGAAVAAGIGGQAERGGYDHVVATCDYHVDPGAHFAQAPDFVRSWPAHCVAGTPGAQLHPDLDTSRVTAVFDKGAHDAAYSGFEGIDADGRLLAHWLRDHRVEVVDVVGIATDYCIRATAMDAVAAGFVTTVLLDLTAAVAAPSAAAALDELRRAGVRLVGEPRVSSSPSG